MKLGIPLTAVMFIVALVEVFLVPADWTFITAVPLLKVNINAK